MPRRVALLLVALVGVGIAACGDDDSGVTSDSPEVPTTPAALEAQEWLLDGKASAPTIEGGQPVTLGFGDEGAFGDAPCNTYTTKVKFDGDDVRFGAVLQTLMSCGDAVDNAERDYTAALEKVGTAQLDDGGNQLILSGGNDVRLVFNALATTEVLQTEWHVVNINTGDAIVGVVDGSDPTLSFENDGTVLVETGCNSGSATWVLDGNALTIDSLAITERACDQPAGVTEQETALVAALESAARVELTPAELRILDANDRILLVATTGGAPR